MQIRLGLALGLIVVGALIRLATNLITSVVRAIFGAQPCPEDASPKRRRRRFGHWALD